ncbi:cytochrome c oxidase assembly protein [Parachitinimonas caeni]|uniref:Cytochrome c oxidase assembly protein CtaG n=1 Tax=Parachitinimonas caeni TaxID=3031301 RepID=A0ABT7DVX4_9NEIS|nr:cytochrome c oxidase assembly protein [Parachitinimonas caeni]MDK2123999.1 cytochrome c oxidase assembly protein [Parachitinimonas caeni]
MSQTSDPGNRQILRRLLIVAVMMFGFGYALVPFYEKICSVTGINNMMKPDVMGNTQIDKTRWITVEFDSNTRHDLPWDFIPEKKKVMVHPGELVHVQYRVTNKSADKVAGQAIPSYSPALAAQYFKKLECFCFAKQTMGGQESRVMPVVFAIEPSLPKDVNTITLSYTFFMVEGATKGG